MTPKQIPRKLWIQRDVLWFNYELCFDDLSELYEGLGLFLTIFSFSVKRARLLNLTQSNCWLVPDKGIRTMNQSLFYVHQTNRADRLRWTQGLSFLLLAQLQRRGLRLHPEDDQRSTQEAELQRGQRWTSSHQLSEKCRSYRYHTFLGGDNRDTFAKWN